MSDISYGDSPNFQRELAAQHAQVGKALRSDDAFAVTASNTPVDPTTVESLLTMCTGALDAAHAQVTALQNSLKPVLRFGWDTEVSEDKRPNPETNCPVGEQIAAVWSGITELEHLLAIVYQNVRL